ncbi:hAT family C-terminal dimerization region [Phytophthora infestans]|uniref:HAT family C-terminal dimerization region n=1 Tax=Phytophthora infestans TaxID=4787 RepID=A0A833TCX3_PHYIN|nr:hAT family C-terminal dimerization region [Phytophthora infestans]KAF4134093.1 hAT family C-terminal dimerization region [Phytophthora infestans]
MASETQPPSTSVGQFTVADESGLPASSPAPAVLEPPTKKRRGAGRKRDPVWDFTTVFEDKRVVCNRCGALIHRYGVAKVERVRAHFERKCPGVHSQTATPLQRGNEATGTTKAEQSLVGTELKEPRLSSGNSYGNKSGAFKRKFAYWLYATGQSFEDVQNELLLNALRMLRTDATLPSKHELENELLNLEFIASKSKVTKALSGKKCCLTVENWVGTGGCGVTTYGATCEGASYYLDSKTAASQESGAELTADEVEAVLTKEKKADFCGIVTPTTSALSKPTRDRIQKKHPRCAFFHGCVCNALTLLLDDVSSILPWLKKLQMSVADVMEMFHGNLRLQTLVSALASPSETIQTVEFPDSSSTCASLEDLLKHEKVLYAIVARRDFVDASVSTEQEKLKRVQDFVLGETFVQDLANALAVLRPLQQQLKHFQEDRPPLSQVFPNFVELLTIYSSMEWVSKKEKALITSCVTERFNAIYGDSHGVAYTLDPVYLGEALDERKKQEVESFIVRFCEREGHTVDILTQLQMYKAMVTELKETNLAYWQLLHSGAVTPHDFWVERRGQFPYLHQLAIAVFGLPASSASPSPSFGVQCFTVQSRFKRILEPEQLQKLTHVYCNSKGGASDPLMSLAQNI